MGIKIVIDSGSDIINNEQGYEGIEILPIKLYFGDHEYIPGVNLNNKEFYDKLREVTKLPHTVQINPQEYYEVFKKIIDEKDQILCITLSSALSGTYNSALIAMQEIDSKNIQVVDSLNAIVGFRSLVDIAIEQVKLGKSLIQITDYLNNIKKNIRLMAVVDDLKYLKMGGRLKAAEYTVANFFRIKPILHVHEGEVKSLTTSRGFKKGYEKIAAMISDDVDYTKPIYVAHSDCPEKIKDFVSVISNKIKLNDYKAREIGPAIGTHTGPGIIGIMYYVK